MAELRLDFKVLTRVASIKLLDRVTGAVQADVVVTAVSEKFNPLESVYEQPLSMVFLGEATGTDVRNTMIQAQYEAEGLFERFRDGEGS